MNEHREFYRKKLSSPGFLIQPSRELRFQIRDVSIDGFQAHFEEEPLIETDTLVRIRLPALNLEGNATVIRIAREPEGGYTVGFLFGELAQAFPYFPLPPADQVREEEF